jgi:hypothetical protein
MPGQLIPRERASFIIRILGRMDSKALRTLWRKPSVVPGNETLIACSFIPYTSHCRLITELFHLYMVLEVHRTENVSVKKKLCEIESANKP